MGSVSVKIVSNSNLNCKMNLGNYQVPSMQNNSKPSHPTLQEQLKAIERKGENITVPSSVTVCCRIKRPTVVTYKNGETSIMGSAKKKESRRNQSVRSSAQSLKAYRNHPLYTDRSETSLNSEASHSSVPRIAQIYSSQNNYFDGRQRSSSNLKTKKKRNMNSTFGKPNLNFVTTDNKNRMNRSICSDNMGTPTSVNSRRSMSQMSNSNVRRTSSRTPGTTSQRKIGANQSANNASDKVNFQIFSTVDDSNYVVCVPPVATSQVGFSSKTLKQKVITVEDLACFDIKDQQCSIFNFDKVINDAYSSTFGVTKLYNKVVKHKIQDQWPDKSACILMFGPSDVNKQRKESHLLSSDIDVNLALKTAKDLIQKQKDARGQGLLYCSVMQVYQDELIDLVTIPTANLKGERKKKGPYFNEDHGLLNNCGLPLITVSGQICQPVRSMQDMAQVLRVAQQNRELISKTFFNMNVVDMRKRSHLIVRLIPENISAGFTPAMDFVELCGSDLAASASIAAGSRSSEKDRQFATTSFNSLSQALLSASFRNPFKPDNHTLLTKVLSQSMLSKDAKIVFCTNLHATATQLKHGVTALKFSQKIREAIQKRLQKLERRNKVNIESNMNQTIIDIENELNILKQKLFNPTESMNRDDPTLIQFAEILDKYEQKVAVLKQSALSNMKGNNGASSTYDSLRHDAAELEKIRHDLGSLRNEIEQCEQEDQEESATVNLTTTSPQPPQHQRYDPFAVDASITQQKAQDHIDRSNTRNVPMISAPTPNFLSGQQYPEGMQINQYQETENDYQNQEDSAYQEQEFQNEQATSIIIDEQKLSQMQSQVISEAPGQVRDDQELEKLIGQFRDQSNMLTSIQYMKLYGDTNYNGQNTSNIMGNNTSNMTGHNTSNIIGNTSGMAGNTTGIMGQTQPGEVTNHLQVLMAQKQEDQAIILNLKNRLQKVEQSSTLQVEALKQQMLHLQETNVKLKEQHMGNENPMSIESRVGRPERQDPHQQEIISMLKQENQKLREDLEQQQRCVQDSEFEAEQLRNQVSQIDHLYKKIETLQGTETEMGELVKRQAELEMNVIQQQSHVEIALKDKKQAESDLDVMRDKLKEVLKEKIELENNFNMIQKHELTRLNELEQKFQEISEQYLVCKEEVQTLRKSEYNLREELKAQKVATQNYKEQFLEMREVNKDLKLHFSKLQRQVETFEEGSYHHRQDNGHKKKKQRYNSSDEEYVEEAQNNERKWEAKQGNGSGFFKGVNRIESTAGSDKENHRASNKVIRDYGVMSSIQESQQEDKSFRKRQNMLSDIQSMIKDYKQKAQYSNLVANHDDHNLASTIKQSTIEAEEMPVPASRLTYRTGDSFNISGTSRSNSRTRTFQETGLSQSRGISASRSRSRSRQKMSRQRSREGSSSCKRRSMKSPFAPSRSKRNESMESGGLRSGGDPYDVIV